MSKPVRTDGGFNSGNRERQAHYPDVGYHLVEIDMLKPPGEALTGLSHFLRLSEIKIPETTQLTDYVVYDADGRAYDYEDLHVTSASHADMDIGELIEEIRSAKGRQLRLALYKLAVIAAERPEDCIDAIPVLTPKLGAKEKEIRVEALHALSLIGGEYPEQVAPAGEEVIEFLNPQHDPNVRADAVWLVAAIAEKQPQTVVDAAAKLAALLQDDNPGEAKALDALRWIAVSYPDAVIPVTPELLSYLNEDSIVDRIGALAILGTVSKEYPYVADETISTALALLEDENQKVRANAAGLLAELADEYPDQLIGAVPEFIELLSDEDEKARYNATSILARLAKVHPTEVEKASKELIEALEEDFPYARSNACWALGYLEAEEALGAIEDLKQNDPNEEVRDAAQWAITAMKDK